MLANFLVKAILNIRNFWRCQGNPIWIGNIWAETKTIQNLGCGHYILDMKPYPDIGIILFQSSHKDPGFHGSCHWMSFVGFSSQCAQIFHFQESVRFLFEFTRFKDSPIHRRDRNQLISFGGSLSFNSVIKKVGTSSSLYVGTRDLRDLTFMEWGNIISSLPLIWHVSFLQVDPMTGVSFFFKSMWFSYLW